jgi:hypothetical protein
VDRLSPPPLAIRRGTADPVDIDPSPLQLELDEPNYDANTLKAEARSVD